MYFERDENAIIETEKKYKKLCMRISKNILGDEHEAEECVNDTYLGIWNAIPPQRPNSLMAFAAKIARNLSLKKLSYKSADKRSAQMVISLSELENVISDGDDDILKSTDEELGKVISDFLMTEKEDARNVFTRKYFYFDTIEDISQKYGFSESKIKSMLFHTRGGLKNHLHNMGIHV